MRIVQVLAALLTPTIAIVAVYIAYQQHLTNKRQLKLALFDKRMAVYNAVGKLLSLIIRDANVELRDVFEFEAETRNSLFLFGKDILDYIEEVRKKAIKLHTMDRRGHPQPEDETELLLWFTNQLVGARSEFARYMSFEKVR